MTPKVFISSTIEDQLHLRNMVRSTIDSIGFEPIMSEHNNVGFLPDLSTCEACCRAVNECQIAIILIGKRYGNIGPNGISITHEEYRAAKKANIPTYSLVDEEVLSFKKIRDANTDRTHNYPGMTDPEEVFKFISEAGNTSVGNNMIPYRDGDSATLAIKRQLAHLVGDLLRRHFDPISSEIKDILSEVKTLRHELLQGKGDEPLRYLRAMRSVLNDDDVSSHYRDLIEKLAPSLDEAVYLLLQSNGFCEFVQNSGIDISVKDQTSSFFDDENRKTLVAAQGWSSINEEPKYWALRTNRKLEINSATLDLFEKFHDTLIAVDRR